MDWIGGKTASCSPADSMALDSIIGDRMLLLTKKQVDIPRTRLTYLSQSRLTIIKFVRLLQLFI